MIMSMGQFPAYCPQCRVESTGKEIPKGRIESPALHFLVQRNVITKDFMLRFMKQQQKGVAEYFRCPAKCGNFLKNIDLELIGANVVVQKLGKCPDCSITICCAC